MVSIILFIYWKTIRYIIHDCTWKKITLQCPFNTADPLCSEVAHDLDILSGWWATNWLTLLL
jgi:hypothetical protein